MTTVFKTIVLLLLLSTANTIFAQTNQEKALEKGKAAVELMDNGKPAESIALLEEAHDLDPDNIDYPYEMAYAYYLQADYKKAIKFLEKIEDHKDVQDRVFQLLGNSYDNAGKPDKAIAVYEKGVKKFPKSGNLYLELGNMQVVKKEYGDALAYYEKGIEVAPRFSSNYYWAAKIFCSSNEEVWGMMYGEIFMNLERNSKRTVEISKLLYDTYKSEIKIESDTSKSVSFCKTASININDLKNPGDIKLPYGNFIYEPMLLLSIIGVKSININSLDTIRSKFIDLYYRGGHDKKYPNVLFSFQKQVKDAGHMEAYNHWILMKGDPDGFDAWELANKQQWEEFVKWFGENKLTLSDSNKFYSKQY